MRVMILEPMKEHQIQDIGSGLESMQKVVGGSIELFCPFERSDIAIICNEEGKLLGLPQNRIVTNNTGNSFSSRLIDILHGTVFICRADPEDEEFSSLTDEQIEWLTPRIHTVAIWA